MKFVAKSIVLLALFATNLAPSRAQDSKSAAQRGYTALTTRSYVAAPWQPQAFDELWKHWQPPLDKKPEPYAQAIQDRYGLHPAPYPNGNLPMGLREGELFFLKGITSDCMMCHSSSLLGKSYIGMGNQTLDIQGIFEDLNRASGLSTKLPFTFGRNRGTSEAGAMAVYLLSFREPDLKLRFKKNDFVLRDDLCEDVPAWWLLKKKKTMYYTGGSHAESVRSIMQFMLSPTTTAATFAREEATFKDIQAYINSIEAPKYPYPIDEPLAAKGEKLFGQHCAKCHGTYGAEPTYPNKIIPLEVIGTDRNRFDGIPAKVGEFYNTSWFSQEKGPDGFKVRETDGYQAPPLDGVWATAPYLHNGSLPTLYDVLNSKSRPKIFTRSFRTDAEAYDIKKAGWKVQILDRAPDATVSAYERRRVYDTTQPGRGNAGHTFGDAFTDEQRAAVIEYLKKL
jgi:mono/diheme cytochrome c family protein